MQTTAADRNAASAEMRLLASSANEEFAKALVGDAESTARSLPADLAWANPTRANPGAGQSASRRRAAADLRSALSGLRSAAQSVSAASDPAKSFAAARQALAGWQRFGSATAALYSLQTAAGPASVETRPAPASAASVVGQPASVARSQAGTRPEPGGTGVSQAKIRQFNAIIDDGRGMAKQVIRMGSRNRPRSNASAEERQAYQLRQANEKLARDYDKYLVTLKDSMRGVNSDREADRLITQANQTKAYLQFLVKASSEAR